MLTIGTRLGPMKSSRRLAPAAWAKCIARATPSSGATWRSRSCRARSPPTPIDWRASSAKRACWPRSTTRTSARSTASRRAADVRALVLELVEGQTLAERIARGPLRCDGGAGDRAADRRCARGGAREGHRSSRPEAGQHQGHARGRGEGPRLRAGQSCRPATGVSRRPHRVADR